MVDDRDDAALAVDVLQPEAETGRGVRVAANRPDDRADDRELRRCAFASWLGVNVGVEWPATAV